MLIKIIEPDFTFKDNRGELTQLVHCGYSQFNIVSSKSGVVRGDHYHKKNTEVFYVIDGSFAFTASKDGRHETHIFKKGDMFLVPPFVMHSFRYLEDSIVAAVYDIGIERAGHTKDIFTE